MGPNREKKDQNENWAPMNGGGVFLSSSVRRGDRFFPGTLFQQAGEAGINENQLKIDENWQKSIIVQKIM